MSVINSDSDYKLVICLENSVCLYALCSPP